MFRKEFSVKTRTALKKSDKRALLERLSQCFKNALQEEISSLIPLKDEIILTKLRTHAGDNVVVYSVKNDNGDIPMFFMEEDRIYPTVYTLWKCPNLVVALETYKPVFNPISNGADLMSPGVKREAIGPTGFGISDVCAVRITGSMAAVAVGLTALSREALISEGQPSGKAVIIKHTFKDYLWLLGPKTDLPDIPYHFEENAVHPSSEQAERTANEGNDEVAILQSGDTSEPLHISITDGELSVHLPNQEEMDVLLEQCFLCALKKDGRRMDLPILASDFYKNYIVAYAPESTRVDVKKSKYKKVTHFLKKMHELGIIEFTDEDAQRANITSINMEHDKIADFRIPSNLSKSRKIAGTVISTGTTDTPAYCPPDINVVYLATSQVLDLLKCVKKQAFTRSEVNQMALNYARENNLQDKETITIDPFLGSVILARSENMDRMHMKDVTDRILNKMTLGYKFTFQGRSEIRNGKPKSIEIEKKKKASNKMVTSVKNLNFFEMDLDRLASDLKKDLSCSVSISDDVLSLQGDHQNAIKKHLKSCYNFPEKYIVVK